MLSISLDKAFHSPSDKVLVQMNHKLPKLAKASGLFATLSCSKQKQL